MMELELIQLLLRCRSSGTLPEVLNARIDAAVHAALTELEKGGKDE